MPYRRTPIVPGEIYHVFNRSIARQPIFPQKRNYQRALDVINYYVYEKPGLRFSFLDRLAPNLKKEFLDDLKKTGKKQVELYAFCLMPNHFHFLLKETQPQGIKKFMSNIQNSYAKYFNTRTERTGALFQAMFKAIRIQTDEQFLHVMRYIHLNPLTSYELKEVEELETYPWSSFIDYLGKRNLSIITTQNILRSFSSIAKFKEFIFDQVDYQRTLERIKHLALE